MDDLGNLLYILFAIVAVVFNIWKKGKQVKPNTPPPTDNNDPFEEVLPDFEQLFGRKEKVKTEPDIHQEVPAPKKEVINKSQDEWKKRLQQAEDRLKRVAKKEPISLQVESESKNSSGWFDARKAIIYSEILKRPDF
ncbi:hypothetical protein [Plebeiibacterium marinum]|uniref:Uncharacterized protein n=1 Tax=Plebeiibacterium marinum TaxID=2992111 RepID=A0AAE3MCC8_9BACT|nr:hypothetical protein [Plebeiobacterium marinum]MCW3805153.1 hypothetical protein [Plebeiobacterium marinum]